VNALTQLMMLEAMSNGNLQIDLRSNPSPREIRSEMKRLKSREKRQRLRRAKRRNIGNQFTKGKAA